MKPKPLKWTEEKYGWRAMTPFGAYLVEKDDGKNRTSDWFTTFRSGEIDDCDHETDQAAKAACEADWERRVKECCE